jgi:hypothetical protein
MGWMVGLFSPVIVRQVGERGVAPSFSKRLSVLTKDIGYFEPMLSHLLLPSPSVVRTSRIGRSSSGLTVVRNLRSETWR